MIRFIRRMIKRKVLTKGLFGGDRKWLALGTVIYVFGRIRGVLGFGEPETVYVEELKSGERLVTAHSEPPRRRKRRS